MCFFCVSSMCFKPSKKYSTGCTQWARKKTLLAEKHLNPKYRICFYKKKHFFWLCTSYRRSWSIKDEIQRKYFFQSRQESVISKYGIWLHLVCGAWCKGQWITIFCGKTESFRILLDPDQFQFRFLGSAAAQEDTNNQCRVRHDD